MKWGVRHEPENHDKGASARNKRTKKLSNKAKRRLKIGAIAAASVLAIAGGIYVGHALRTSRNIDSISNLGQNVLTGHSGIGNAVINKNLGKSPSDIAIDSGMIKAINANNFDLPDGSGRRNCVHASTSYILNSLYGMNTTARPFSGVDEVSGLKTGDLGRDMHLLDSIFDGINHKSFPGSKGLISANKEIPNGSTGMLRSSGHVFNYEKTKQGVLTLIDCQYNDTIKVDGSNSKKLDLNLRISDIYDFSSSSLKDDADKVLRHLVNK